MYDKMMDLLVSRVLTAENRMKPFIPYGYRQLYRDFLHVEEMPISLLEGQVTDTLYEMTL